MSDRAVCAVKGCRELVTREFRLGLLAGETPVTFQICTAHETTLMQIVTALFDYDLIVSDRRIKK